LKNAGRGRASVSERQAKVALAGEILPLGSHCGHEGVESGKLIVYGGLERFAARLDIVFSELTAAFLEDLEAGFGRGFLSGVWRVLDKFVQAVDPDVETLEIGFGRIAWGVDTSGIDGLGTRCANGERGADEKRGKGKKTVEKL
jgi:hypothetical protein